MHSVKKRVIVHQIHADVEFLRFKSFPETFNAVMTTRRGGISSPPWASANMHYRKGDTIENVMENRRSVLEKARFKNKNIWFVNQVHGSTVICADGMSPEETYSTDADGIFTTTRDLICGVYVADCIPLLLAGENMVAAVHCGWRSIVSGIVSNAIKHFTSRGLDPAEIFAATGAGIGQCCFETGQEVADIFINSGYKDFVSSGKNIEKSYVDLQGVIFKQLKTEGLSEEKIIISTECTFCDEDKFFSYRRNGWPGGQMMAIIAAEQK